MLRDWTSGPCQDEVLSLCSVTGPDCLEFTVSEGAAAVVRAVVVETKGCPQDGLWCCEISAPRPQWSVSPLEEARAFPRCPREIY